MAIPLFKLPSNTGIPSPAEVQRVVELYTPGMSDMEDPSLQLLPFEENPNSEIVAWHELPYVHGLLPAYTPGSAPQVEGVEGLKAYAEKTLHFAKTYQVLGTEIINRLRPGTSDQMAGEWLAMRAIRRGNIHLDSRNRQQRWATLFGSNAVDDNGVKRTITQAVQTALASTPWSTVASADMIADLAAFGEKFDNVSDGKIVAYISKKTAKYMMQNAKFLALVAGKSNIQPSEVNIKNIGKLVAEFSGVVDEIRIYNGGYLNSSRVKQFYIPEGKMLLAAQPPDGYPVGAYRTTPAVQNPNFSSGRWSVVDDRLQTKYACWDVTIGFHGTPVLYFPDCLCVATLYTP